MTPAHLGPTMLVKEDDPRPYYQILFEEDREWCFFGKTSACSCQHYLDQGSGIPIYPKRCAGHNKKYMRWRRKRDLRVKILDLFDWRRHMCIKMLEFSLHRETVYLEDLAEQRAHGLRRFKNLRKSKFWKEHVDGGVWFYEFTDNTSDETVTIDCPDGPTDLGLETGTITWDIGTHTTVHPHVHCLLLSPKKIPMDLLNAELKKRDLGHAFVTVPKDRHGNIIDDDKMSVNMGLGYALKYVEKDIQANSRNRGTFGTLHGNGLQETTI